MTAPWQPAPSPGTAAGPMTPGTSRPEHVRTIMLVEDEPITRSSIQRFLEQDGYRVVSVDAAEEGIVEAGETAPDVLIADVHLPGLSGIELAAFMLAQDPGLAVILMTADPDAELARRALACGPVQYMLKPFDWHELQAAVHQALRRRDEASESLPEIPGHRHEALGAGAPPDGLGAAAAGIDAGGNATAVADWDVAFDAGSPCTDFPMGADDPDEASPPVAFGAGGEVAWPVSGRAGPVPLHGDPHETAVWTVGPDPGGTRVDEVLVSGVESVVQDAPVAALAEPQGSPQVPAWRVDGAASTAREAEASRTDDWVERSDRASFAGPGHGDRVARIAHVLLGELAEQVTLHPGDLTLAARVHEVGRIQLPDGDAVGVAAHGAQLLDETGFPRAVTEVIRHMHERWDGTAGPEGLSGTRIPAGARILAVADALDHYVSAWMSSGLEPELAAEKAMHLVTVQQNLAFGPAEVLAVHRASDALLRICAQGRLREQAQPVPIPAIAANESVPFALFASD